MLTGVFASIRLYRWVGHVARMGEERNASKIVVGRPQGKIQLSKLGVLGGGTERDLKRVNWRGGGVWNE